MIKSKCPEFHSDTQKYYICVDKNTSIFKDPIILSFTSLLKAKHISEMEILQIIHTICNSLKKYENSLFLEWCF